MSPVWKSVKIKNLDHEASGRVGGGQCIHIKLSKKEETSCFRDLRLHAQAPARRAVLASLSKGSKVAPFFLVALRVRPELWVPPAPGCQRCDSFDSGWVWHRVLLLNGTKHLPTGGRGGFEGRPRKQHFRPLARTGFGVSWLRPQSADAQSVVTVPACLTAVLTRGDPRFGLPP